MSAGFGFEVLAVLKIEERLYIIVCRKHHIGALAARSTVRLAVIVIPVIKYTMTALAAVAGLQIDFGLVYEHCKIPIVILIFRYDAHDPSRIELNLAIGQSE